MGWRIRITGRLSDRRKSSAFSKSAPSEATAQHVVGGFGERMALAGAQRTILAKEGRDDAICGGVELHHLVKQIGGKFEKSVRMHAAIILGATMSDSDLVPLPPTPLGRYRHYKGGEYEVIGVAVATAKATLTLSFSVTDSDLPANVLTFSLDTAPVGASVTSSGVFSWTPGFDQAGTTNNVVVRVTDNGTPSLSTTQAFSVTVPNNGLKADYFAGTNFDTLVFTRNDTQVDFDWSTGAPGPGLPTNQFSVRWTGQVIPRYSQTYTFYTVSDDGVRLWVDGQPLINNWTVHLPTTNTATIALTAGQKYMVKLEYFDGTGGAVSRLMWSSKAEAPRISGSRADSNTYCLILVAPP
jgi:hypothetical protein